MIILNGNGGYAISKYNPNTDFSIEKKAIQIIDDNSELGKKIISMIPNVKLIYTDGVVTDCEELEQSIPEPTTEEQVTNIQELIIQQQYELELLKLGIEV